MPAVGERDPHLAPLGLPDEFVQERTHSAHLENREDDRRLLARPGREAHDRGLAVYNVSAELDLVVQPKSETRLPDCLCLLLCRGLAPLDARGSLVGVVRGGLPSRARSLPLSHVPRPPAGWRPRGTAAREGQRVGTKAVYAPRQGPPIPDNVDSA